MDAITSSMHYLKAVRDFQFVKEVGRGLFGAVLDFNIPEKKN